MLGLLLAALLAPPLSAETKVMVVPPQPTGESLPVPWVAEVVADMIPLDLSRLGVPALPRVERLRAYEALDIPPVALTHATSVRLAEALGVSRIVTGTYEVPGKQVRLSLRSLDVERGTLSPPLMATALLDALPALLHGLAWDIALAGPWKPAGTREDFLARAASLPPSALEAYGLGLAAGKAGARAEHLRRALKLKPDYDEARLALARLQIESQEYAAADATLAVIKDDSPLGRSASFLRGLALMESGRNREAAALLEHLAAQEATPGVLSNQGLALLRAKAGGASALLRQAAERAPAWTDVAFNLGWSLLVEGDTEAAVFWLRGVTQQAPGDVYARIALSWALRKGGRGEEAAEEWRAVALSGAPTEGLDRPDMDRSLGRVVSSEQPSIIERSDVQTAAGHVGRAEALLKANDAEGALRELTRAAYL